MREIKCICYFGSLLALQAGGNSEKGTGNSGIGNTTTPIINATTPNKRGVPPHDGKTNTRHRDLRRIPSEEVPGFGVPPIKGIGGPIKSTDGGSISLSEGGHTATTNTDSAYQPEKNTQPDPRTEKGSNQEAGCCGRRKQ